MKCEAAASLHVEELSPKGVGVIGVTSMYLAIVPLPYVGAPINGGLGSALLSRGYSEFLFIS